MHFSIDELGIDKEGNIIRYKDKVALGDHTGIIEYSRSECRFIIKWDDGHYRSFNHHIAKELLKI